MHLIYKNEFRDYIDFRADFNKFYKVDILHCTLDQIAMYLNEFLDVKFLINKNTKKLLKLCVLHQEQCVIRETLRKDFYYYEVLKYEDLKSELTELLDQYHTLKFTEY